jgi:hypothetical protein
MTDPILKKAMEKRDAALREVERWEEWIKGYMDLSEPTPDSLDIPMVRSARLRLRPPAVEISPRRFVTRRMRPEVGNGKAVWPRGGSVG